MPNTPSPEPEAARVELLPCPFCGGSASFEEIDSVVRGSAWTVGCNDAGGTECIGFQPMTTFSRKSDAAKAWNRRAALANPAQADAAGMMVEVDVVHWRCFHCDETFTRAQAAHARDHFGATECERPVCLIREPGEYAVLRALRKAEDDLAGYRAEDQEILRAMWSMSADHRQALIREEERGYAKGFADAKLEVTRAETTEAELSRLRAEIAELRAGREWQNISTAPKDGSKFLAIDAKAPDRIWVVWRATNQRDFVMDHHGGLVIGLTHWQQLPEPPRTLIFTTQGARHDGI